MDLETASRDGLLAAVRAVEALAESLRQDANAYQYAAPGSYDAGARTSYEAIAARIEGRLSSALGAEGADRG